MDNQSKNNRFVSKNMSERQDFFNLIPPAWAKAFPEDFSESQLWGDIVKRLRKNVISYPLNDDIFKALSLTSPQTTKIVILGQDPYHNSGQAHGLAFSVVQGVKAPPSLKNIFKELENDLGIKRERTDLSDWAEQGVLLLNSALTVEENKPGVDLHLWEELTDQILSFLSVNFENIVFIFWGGFALKKKHLIDENKHLVLKAPHPSPLSSYRGFFGSKPFSTSNEFLKLKGKPVIKW